MKSVQSFLALAVSNLECVFVHFHEITTPVTHTFSGKGACIDSYTHKKIHTQIIVKSIHSSLCSESKIKITRTKFLGGVKCNPVHLLEAHSEECSSY